MKLFLNNCNEYRRNILKDQRVLFLLIFKLEGRLFIFIRINSKVEELNYKIQPMIFLLPLIILAAANPCPYCKWGYCDFTEGHLANCSACYDLAGLVPLKIAATSINEQLSPIGVCQLCPEHCGSCQYALEVPSFAPPIPILNCTYCYAGYTTDHLTGKCAPCPSNCDSCHFQVISLANSRPYGVINCTSCYTRYTNNYFSGQCEPCPQHCASCQCMFKGCITISCTTCDPGYITNATQSGGYECIPEGGRLLIAEEGPTI